jgi:hypothetical protein
MRKTIRIFLMVSWWFVSFWVRAERQTVVDSAALFTPKHSLIVAMRAGGVLATNSYVTDYDLKFYSAVSLKYILSAAYNLKDDLAFGHPYFGCGFSTFRFTNARQIGYPFAFYLLQGGSLLNLGNKFSFNYEWNAGISFNWKPYDPVTNQDAIAIGSRANAYIGLDLYFKCYLIRYWNLQLGAGLSHFSNGATRLPNRGLNMYSPVVGLVYNLNGAPIENWREMKLKEAKHPFPVCFDVSGLFSFKQVAFDTVGTKLAVPYVNNNFTVLGANVTALFRKGYKYRWGPALNLVYDESVGASACIEQYATDKYYLKVNLGEFYKRFSMGVSMYGEILIPRVSLFGNVGYDVIHFKSQDSRFYQIVGVKLYLNHTLYTTVGIRANKFSKAQFIYFTIGNTFGSAKK